MRLTRSSVGSRTESPCQQVHRIELPTIYAVSHLHKHSESSLRNPSCVTFDPNKKMDKTAPAAMPTEANDQTLAATGTDAAEQQPTRPSNDRVPRIQISYSFNSDVCHKSGWPPFSVQLCFHNLENYPVTLHRSDWIFKLPTALHIPDCLSKTCNKERK